MTRPRRSRPRPRGRSGWWRLLVGLALLAALLVSFGVPTASFTSSTAPRSSGIDVVSDESGVLALNVSAELGSDATNCLVRVSNHFDSKLTATVALQADSQSLGDLRDPATGGTSGDQVSFDVASGATEEVPMDVASNTTGETVRFDVTADAGGTSVDAPGRSSPITTTGDPNTCA